MERMSDERLEELSKIITATYMGIFDRDIISALTELRERRVAEKAADDEDDRMVAEWYKRS